MIKAILFLLPVVLWAQVPLPSPTNGGAGGGGGGTIPSTTSTLRGDGSGNAAAVTGTGTDCVLVDGSSTPCSGGATGDAAAPVTTTCSGASATFTATSNTFNKFTCTLVATNVTSSTLASLTTGQSFSITWIQPAGGGITFAAITGITGMGTIDGSANASCTQPFVADSASTAHQSGAMTCTGGTPGYCFNNSSSGTTCFQGPTTGTNVFTAPAGTHTGGYVLASGTASLGTSSISANSCATAVTVSATGVATTDVISFSPNADISGVTGYGAGGTLTIRQYPTADNVNFLVCNADQSSAVTPGAVTLNWMVPR